MKKRNLVLPSLVALTLPLAALAHQDAAQVRHGFYVGAAAGASKLTADFDQTLYADYALLSDGGLVHVFGYTNQKFKEDAYRALGQIQVGYAIEWEWLYVGLEASLNGSEMKLEQNNTLVNSQEYEGYVGTLSSQSDVQLNNFEPVADLKIGFTLPTRTYLYARLGAAFNTLKLTETTTFEQFNELPGFYISQYFRESDTDSVVGFRIGAGIEHRFYDHVSVGLDYVYTDYGQVYTVGHQPTKFYEGGPDNDYQVYDRTRVDVNRNIITLGVNYFFW